MEPYFLLRNFSKPFKGFILAFLFVLSVGYFTGLSFVAQTDSNYPSGIVENYNGNEDSEKVLVMKFQSLQKKILKIF